MNYELDKALALLNEGKQKAEQGDLFGAIAAFTQSIQLNPDDADAYIERGRLLLSMGDKKAATADMLEAVRLRPTIVEGTITNKQDTEASNLK